MDKLNNKNRGFLTLEMMIAMVIMLTAVSAVILTSFGDQNFLVGGQTNSEAVSMAQELLEQAQANSRRDFRMVNSTSEVVDDIYKKSITVSPSSVLGDYFTKKVTSLVSWTDDSHIERSVTLSTLITNFENALGGDTCESFLTGDWSSPSKTNITLGNLLGDSGGAYKITDLDVYKGKMYITVNQTNESSGANNPSTAVNSGSGLTWSNPDRVYTSNNSYATRLMSGTNNTAYINATNFGFNIPNGATILGITVAIEKSRSSGSNSNEVRDNEVRLILPNGSLGVNNYAKTSTNWSTSDSYTSYGGVDDVWGEDMSVSDINNINFGVAISAKGNSNTKTNRTAQVDHIRITVTYIKEFYIFNISNPTNPSFISGLANSVSGTGLNAVKTNGRYAYVSTNAGPSTGQLQIIDVSVNPAKLVSTFTMPSVSGSGSQALGNSIFYKNGYAYVGLTKTFSGPEFHIIDVHNPASPVWLGSYQVGSSVNSIYVRADTAYITTSDNTKEFMMLDISNPYSPTLKLTYNAMPDQTNFGYGRSQYLVGDTWYLGRTYISSSGAPEYTVLDISKATPSILSSKDIGPNSTNPFSLNSLLVRDYLAFLLTGSATKGGSLQIIRTADSSQYTSPITLPGGSAGAGGTAMDCEGNYIYASSVDSSNKSYITVVTAS